MKQWHHRVDPKWMAARRKCLTATDVVSLLPEYKRMQKKQPGTISPGCAALWMEKASKSEPDCDSYNAAARGHVMEPYALEEYSYSFGDGSYWFHWDDCLIYDDEDKRSSFPLAFSPDAMLISQPNKYAVPATMYGLDRERQLLEIKCYEPKRHMQSLLADKADLPERYQLAVGMLLMGNVEKGTLFFYNPSCTDAPMFARVYSRRELEDEMDAVRDVHKMFNDTVRMVKERVCIDDRDTLYTEDYIYQQSIMEGSDVFFIRR